MGSSSKGMGQILKSSNFRWFGVQYPHFRKPPCIVKEMSVGFSRTLRALSAQKLSLRQSCTLGLVRYNGPHGGVSSQYLQTLLFQNGKKNTVRHDIRNVHTDINKICFKFLKPWRNIMPIFESRFQDGIIHWGSNHRPGKEQNPHVLRVPAKVDWWPTPNMATVYHPSSSNSCVLFFHIPLNHHFKGQQSNFWSSITWLGNSK